MPAVHPFTALMVNSEVSVLRCLHGMLENDSVETREQFCDLMKATFEYGKLDPKELSNDLGYSLSTVYRWIEGRTAPHRCLWPKIIEWIMLAIDKRIASCNQLEEAHL